MKKYFRLLSFLLISSALTACCKDQPVVVPEPEPEVKKLEKTHLAYTYSDYHSNYYLSSSATPSIGEPSLLVIPVYFNDSNTVIPEDKKDVVKNDIYTAFFGTKEEIGYDSVTSYYETLSCGKCKIKGLVSKWIDVDESYLNYGVNEETTIALVTSVVENYFAESNDIRTTYDLDKNGFLDGVVIIYAAPDTNSITNTIASNLWAYTNWNRTSKPNVENPTLCNFMWASYDFMYSRSTAKNKIGNYYACGDTKNCEIDTHVFIHEMGHMFGLVDYYDYSSYKYSPAGGFSMQDYNVGSHDPYSVMALGWCDPYIPTESCEITLNSFQSSRDCIILCNSWNSINSPFDEYLLLEFYTPDGLNEFDHKHKYFEGTPGKERCQGPDEIGIRLWHVDARLLYDSFRDATKTTCDPKKQNAKIMHMMSNTYIEAGSATSKLYGSPLGYAYSEYNVLQLIRNEETETTHPSRNFDKYSLFKNGSSFSMSSFSKQFVNKGRLNTNLVLGWTFTVEIADSQAKIKLKRTI